MTRPRRSLFRSLVSTPTLFAALLTRPLLLARPAAAEDWPTRPIKIVIPFAPGGSSDIAARLVAPRLNALLGQSILIENRGGAGGNVAAEYVAHAAPDGYTLFQGMSALSP